MKANLLVPFAILALVGSCRRDGKRGDKPSHDHGQMSSEAVAAVKYTCPMHPQIVRDKPGRCPICGMDLVKVAGSGSKTTEIRLMDTQRTLANIVTQPVVPGSTAHSIVLNGRLVPDQTTIRVISSRAAGRVDRLLAKQTGDVVLRGQLLYELYSESLLSAQQEYLIALRQVEELGAQDSHYESLRKAAERRLTVLGMSKSGIEKLEKTRIVQNRIVFESPVSGTVSEVLVVEGQYVSEGTPLYRLNGLGRLWVEADLYASEVGGVRVGDMVQVQVAGFEERVVSARVTFVSPEYQQGTQLLRVRAELANPRGDLRSGMQATAALQMGVTRALLLPTDAVIRTSEGATVFVETEKNVFQPRMVITGAESGDNVAITGGLLGTESVVVKGAYLLYAELVLKKGVNPMAGHSH
jgi:membrane fusion protein, copper/silver efflux system